MKEKIALGFGNNTDYEIEWDSLIIENCIKEWNIFRKNLKKPEKIVTERDIVITILNSMQTETGGEYIVENVQIVEMFARRFQFKVTVGGTGPRAAIAMRKLHYRSCIHLVTMNDYMRKLLPEDCPSVCSRTDDSSYPHLIVQYMAGTTIKANDIFITTHRANRLILDNDYDNTIMHLNSSFFETYINDAKVLLISGFNIMTDQNLLKDRLSFLKDRLPIIKERGTKIYYEDACFASEKTNQTCKDYLFPYVDIFSFNEDEMQNYSGIKIDLLNPETVFNIVKKLYKRFNVPVIVVHSKYWALAYGDSPGNYSDCLKSGITMATTRFRFGDNFSIRDFRETYHLPEEAEGMVFAHEFGKLTGSKGICRASINVKETKVTTIGLGDAFVGGFLATLSELK